jgi:cytochrome P450
MTAAAHGCPYHKALAEAQSLAAHPDGSADTNVPFDQVSQTVQDHQSNPFLALQQLHEKFGRSFQTQTPTGPVLFDHDQETARAVLVKTEGPNRVFKKSDQQTHGLARALGRENVLLASGAKWRSSREALEGFFSVRSVKTQANVDTISATLEKHLDRLDAQISDSGETQADLGLLLRRATLDVALSHLFSTRTTADELEALGQAYETINQRVGKEWILPSSVTGLEEPSQKFEEATSLVKGFATDLVDSRRREPGEKNDALTALMNSVDPETGRPFDQDRLVSEVQNLMLAGHETTANLITWTLTSIARSPIKQNQMATEIATKVGSGIPQLDKLKRLTSVTSTWREQATEHPPNFLIAREALQDTTVGPKDHPVQVKAGTTVLVSTQHANEGPGMFSFGGGERFCLGFNLARLETELAVTQFLRRFEVTDTGARGVDSGLTQKPSDTLVTVKRR